MKSTLQKMAALLLCLGSVMADVSSLSKSYLPPQEGYNYDAPSIPFPSPSPAPSYKPPGTIAPRPPPNYSTIAPPYSPQITYRPPPSYNPPKPTYVPPPNYDYEGSAISPVTGPGSAGAGTGGGEFDHLKQPHVPGMPYDFNYAVKDDYYGTDFGHQAVSNGDQVRGEYRVALPDGRLQIVKYLADWKDGYTAEVTYQGEAKYPTGPGASGGSLGAGNGYPGSAVRPQPPSYPSPSYPQPGPSYPVQPNPSYPGPISPVKPSGNYPRPGFGGSGYGGSQQQPAPYPTGLPSSGYPVTAKPIPSYPGSAQSGYGGQPSGFGGQQPSYGSQQPDYGSQQSGYGSQQSGYGGQQPVSGYGSSVQPSYSSPAPDYGSYK